MCVRDQHSPLHLSAAWGLEKTVQCLMEHNADVNAKVISFFCTVNSGDGHPVIVTSAKQITYLSVLMSVSRII